MPPSWFNKPDEGDADSPSTPPPLNPTGTGDFQQLAEHLGKLEGLMGEANGQIAAYLAKRESRSTTVEPLDCGPLEAKIAAVADKLDQLESRLKSTAEAAPAAPAPSASEGPSNSEVLTAVNGQNTILRDLVGQLQTQMENGFGKLTDLVAPKEEPSPSESFPAGAAAWEQAILGADLAADANLAFKRQELLEGVLQGDAGARSLAGQLLVFQSAVAGQLPKLLKEIGEAYYAWQPKRSAGSNPLEEALVAWLVSTCEAAGIGNTIELVHLGERFDATRHNAASRGVEIAQVLGWIVLRDNGKVYTKANVTVK